MSIATLPNQTYNCPCTKTNDHESFLNLNNIQNVRNQIALKKQSLPYYGTSADALSIITDYDTWPYPRRFRGIPASAAPVLMEREAGWRGVYNNAYRPNNCAIIEPKCVIGPFGPNEEIPLTFL